MFFKDTNRPAIHLQLQIYKSHRGVTRHYYFSIYSLDFTFYGCLMISKLKRMSIEIKQGMKLRLQCLSVFHYVLTPVGDIRRVFRRGLVVTNRQTQRQ